MTQTYWAIEQLRQRWPNLEVAIEQIHTTGDRITDVPLTRIGGDGVFVTEIERALAERRIDLAVHSLKDLPTAQPDGLRVIVAGPREDVRDVLVSTTPFRIADGRLIAEADVADAERPLRLGTCSLRRTAQLRQLCPEATILPLRGNVDTRLRKLDAGEYDGILLAAAGLHRLDLQARLAERLTYFPSAVLLPAPGQGALGLEIRDEPALRELLAPLHDASVQATTSAERMFMRRLGAGCYLPVAAYAEINSGMLSISGLVISLDGLRSIHVQKQMLWTEETSVEQAEQLGMYLAEEALDQGADAIIAEVNGNREQEHLRV
ncbi:MAG: hydroxymethylbilane synthase [Chloroflexota bacterium]|nr:hydroxymethylbilane synthase [Chloroflexota bacterium]